MAGAQHSNICQDVAVKLMLKHPFFSEVYYSMKVIEDDSVNTAATDGVNMWVSPTRWAKERFAWRTTSVVHECLHKILHHPTRRGDRDPFIWNLACDQSVNSFLIDNKFEIEKEDFYRAEWHGWLPDAVYKALMEEVKKPPPKGKGDKPGEGEGEGEDGDEGEGEGKGDKPGEGKGKGDKPGEGEDEGEGGAGDAPAKASPYWKDAPAAWKKACDIRAFEGTPDEIEKFEMQVEKLVLKALETAKGIGTMPAGLSAALDDAYKPTKEPWFNHLQRFMQSLRSAEYNWARMNKRYAVLYNTCAPANYTEALDDALIFIDCSGSCFAAMEQAQFAGHVNAIMADAKPRRVIVAYFDTKVHSHEEYEAGVAEFESKPRGGGGTSFAGLFDWAIEEGYNPSVAIVLTDMMGTFPEEAPPFPVIWANTYDQETVAPIGETLFITE